MRVFFVRHGETEWNLEGRFQGQSDIPLNARGWQQAERIAERLATEPLAAIFSSDLSRAASTAEVVARYHSIPVCRMPELREACFGAWEGKTYEEVAQTDPERAARWRSDPAVLVPPGGESTEQFASRLEGAMARIRAETPDDATCAVVTHGGPIRNLLCLWLAVALSRYWQFRLDNGSISVVDLYPSGAILARLNDVSHLSQDGSLGLGAVRDIRKTF